MRRRALLRTLAAATAGLSGCSLLESDDADPDEETVTPYEVPTDERTPFGDPTTPGGPEQPPGASRAPEQWLPRVRPPDLVEFGTGPRTLALSTLQFGTPDDLTFAVRTSDTATSDHPARIQALLYNHNDFEKTVRRERFPLLSRTIPSGVHSDPVGQSGSGGGTPGQLFLVPTAGHELDDPIEGVPRGPEGYWHADVHPGDYPYGGTATVPAKQGIVGEYAVCAGRGEGPLEPGTYAFRGPDAATPDSLTTPPVTVVVWPTDAAGPTRPSRFDSDLDPSPGGQSPIEWFHQAGLGTDRYLLPDREVLGLPSSLTVRLVNRAQEWYDGQPTLYKRSGDRWYNLGPYSRLFVRNTDLEPGTDGTQAVDTGVDDSGIAAFDLTLRHEAAARTDGLDFGFLGGGRYALVVDIRLAQRRYGAVLDVEVPPMTATPQPEVSVTRDGSTVTVTDPGVDGPDDAETTFLATQADPSEARPLIDEQVMTRYGSTGRNILSVIEEGVETVRYHSSGSGRSIQFGRLLEAPVTFRGVTVTVTAERDGPTLPTSGSS